jgi:hypothetical protein
MAVVAHVVLPGVTKEQYDQVRAEVGWLEDVPAGGISHVTFDPSQGRSSTHSRSLPAASIRSAPPRS